MGFLLKIKRMFRWRIAEFQVWDSSAVSTWFDTFQKRIDDKRIIVPEGVVQELSAGRHNYERCREAYNLINKNKKIKVHLTADKMKSWSVDEQLVAIAYEYHTRGYNVKVVTCDRDQARQARDRGLEVELLKGNRPAPKKTAPQEDIIKIPCEVHGGKTSISLQHGVAVYGPKGRRIARDAFIPFEKGDTFILNGEEYKCIKKSPKTVLLQRKQDST